MDVKPGPPPGTIAPDFLPMETFSVDGKGLDFRELPVGAAKSLGELLGDYVLFTPAVLSVFGDFQAGPFRDHMAEIGHEFPIYYFYSRRPIFGGLELRNGDKDWNHAIWAVERSEWQPLKDFLVSIRFFDEKQRRVQGIGLQRLLIPDPLALAQAVIRTDQLPLMSLEIFGINGSMGRVAIDHRVDVLDVPRPKFYPPDPKMVAYCEAVVTGANPHL